MTIGLLQHIKELVKHHLLTIISRLLTYQRTGQTPFTYDYQSPSTYQRTGQTPFTYDYRSPSTYQRTGQTPFTYDHRSPFTYARQGRTPEARWDGDVNQQWLYNSDW